jgi:hypothetical protein
MVQSQYVLIGIGTMTIIAALALVKLSRLGIFVVGPLFAFGLLCCCCGAIQSVFFTNVTQEQADKVRKENELHKLQNDEEQLKEKTV